MLEWRKISLPLACIIFHLSKLNPFRSKRIWLFGCWKGGKYDDNSKFLFEYVNENHKQIRCVWLTRKKSVARQVRALGYEAYTAGSLRGFWMQLRGGVAIMTNGLDDFGPFPFIGGAKIISLWHGVGGFKKIYNENYSGLKLKLKKFVDFFFSWTHRSLSLATSEYTAERTMEQFGVKRSSVVITGQPRNDLFHMQFDRKDLLSNVSLEGFSKVVLYMPTYRVSPNTHKDMVKEILDELAGNEKFAKFLQDRNILFLVKLHPLTRFKMESMIPNFRILEDREVISVQHLLMAADCLVTDYSSCAVDFALLNRPVVFYVPDEADYLSYASVNDAYGRVVQEKASSSDELMEQLAFGRLSQTEILNNLFEDRSLPGSCYSENMYRAICKRYKVKE